MIQGYGLKTTALADFCGCCYCYQYVLNNNIPTIVRLTTTNRQCIIFVPISVSVCGCVAQWVSVFSAARPRSWHASWRCATDSRPSSRLPDPCCPCRSVRRWPRVDAVVWQMVTATFGFQLNCMFIFLTWSVWIPSSCAVSPLAAWSAMASTCFCDEDLTPANSKSSISNIKSLYSEQSGSCSYSVYLHPKG